MQINLERLLGRLEKLAAIGATPDGGVTRLAFTPELRRAETLVREWMETAGLETRIDAAGNLIGRRAGARADLPCVMLGSHIDTVVNGGRYDGALGVLAAVEVAQVLHESATGLPTPLEVVSFVDEEGARWSGGFFGSRALTGTLDAATMARTDRSGTAFEAALREFALDPQRVQEAAREPGDIGSYLELHIEQGAVLEAANVALGAVTGIAGTLALAVEVTGRADHAGATPMGDARRDALAGAAQMILAVERIARTGSPTAVATVGRLEAAPNVGNVIAGKVNFSVDLRDIHVETRDLAEAVLRAELQRIAMIRRLKITIADRMRATPIALGFEAVALAERACRAAGVEPIRLPSGAGHDAQIVAGIADAAMLFVRCRGGISHAPDEYVAPEDIRLAAEALFAATWLASERNAEKRGAG